MKNSGFQGGMQSYNLKDFVRALFRNKKKVIFIPLLILSLAAVVILFAPRKYQSEAKLFMQVGRESVKLPATATVGDKISMQSNSRENEIITAIDSLMSRGTIEKVVGRLSPAIVLGNEEVGETETNPLVRTVKSALENVIQLVKSIDPVSEREQAVITIERGLYVDAENDSTLITVQYTAESPQLAQLVTQTLIDVYRDEHLRLYRTTGSKEFFTQQHDILKQQLDESVEQLRNARNRMNLVSIESRQATLESRMADVETSLYTNQQQLASAWARIADTKKQLATTPARIMAEEKTVPNTGTDLLREQVFELQVRMLDLQAKYNDDHPSLRATREQLAKAESMLKTESHDRQEVTNNMNPKYRTLTLALATAEIELEGLEAQEKELRNQRATVIADLKLINDYDLELDQLQRDSQLARTNYLRYADNLEKARIDEALDKNEISNAIKAQEATLAEKPVSPNKLMIAALSVMLSLFAVVATVLMSEKISNPICNEEQLEETLHLPVFGVLPEQKKYEKSIA